MGGAENMPEEIRLTQFAKLRRMRGEDRAGHPLSRTRPSAEIQ